MTDKFYFEADVLGVKLAFSSGGSCFSPSGVDRGTMAMLSASNLQHGEKVLDLGCGYGVVGIWAAGIVGETNVFMLDISEKAVKYAAANAETNGVGGVTVLLSDGLKELKETGFDVILSNPPYHTDFSIAKSFIEKGFNRLKVGGRMLIVTKREKWYKNKLTSVFGGCRVREIDGYYVFEAIRRGLCRADILRKNNKSD